MLPYKEEKGVNTPSGAEHAPRNRVGVEDGRKKKEGKRDEPKCYGNVKLHGKVERGGSC